MTLPRALQPWESTLAQMVPELATGIGPWLHRIHTLIGPLRLERPSTAGELYGYGDLSRRGPYDRLLLSEWLMAEVEPLEFLRRASVGEHLFLQPTRRAPADNGRSLLLIDVGPEQVGLPRIAQLALLIVLEQRATEGGADFAWGALQAAPLLHQGPVDESCVQSFLQARSALTVTSEHLEAWADLVRPACNTDELWLIGDSPELASTWPGAGRLQVGEVVLPRPQRQLELRLRRPGQHEDQVLLDAPADQTSAQLLRNPYFIRHRERAPRKEFSLCLQRNSNVLLASNGRRVLARLDDGRIAAWHVPNTPREPQGRTRFLPPPTQGHVVAVDYHRGFVALGAWAGQLVVWREGNWVACEPIPGLDPPTIAHGLSPCGYWFRDQAGHVVSTSLLCRAGLDETSARLWCGFGSTPASDPSTTDTTAPQQISPRRDAVLDLLNDVAPQPVRLPIDGDRVGLAHLVRAGTLTMALPRDDSGWLVVEGLPLAATITTWYPPADTTVIGLARHDGKPVLVLQESDRRHFSIVGRDCSATLTRAASRVRSYHVGPSGHLTYLTDDDELVVYCPSRQVEVLRLSLERAR